MDERGETRSVEIRGYDGFELIGRGGSAQVFRARQARVGRDVAVKVLDIDLSSPRLRDAFLRECRLTGRVSNHPAITTIYDTGVTDDGRPYLAMELRGGGSLAQEIAGAGSIDPARAASITMQLAGALTAAHATGVLHRDVKPANVVVSRRGEPALTDFGVAAVLGASESTTGPAFTPAHVAPEVLRGETATAASDVYSLGSTLYTMLRGTSPFVIEDATQYEIIGRALHEAPPPLDPALPAALRELVDRMLAKEPDERPTLAETIAELAAVERSEGWPETAVVTSVSDDHDTWDPALALAEDGLDHDSDEGITDEGIAHEVGAREVVLVEDTGATTEPRGHRARWLVTACLVLAVGAVIGLVLVVDDGDDERAGSSTATTTTARPSVTTPTTIVYPGGDDRSIALAAGIARWDDALENLLGERPVAAVLSFAQYYADKNFPKLEQLPATTSWFFVNPLIPGLAKPCNHLLSGPLTMEGMIGRASASSEAVVTLAKMEFATADQAHTFMTGRSLALGATKDECTIEDGEVVSIDHDALGLEPPPGVDELNSWVFGPGDQILPIERGAFAMFTRRGTTVAEIRIGMRGERVFTNEEIAGLVDQSLSPG